MSLTPYHIEFDSVHELGLAGGDDGVADLQAVAGDFYRLVVTLAYLHEDALGHAAFIHKDIAVVGADEPEYRLVGHHEGFGPA